MWVYCIVDGADAPGRAARRWPVRAHHQHRGNKAFPGGQFSSGLTALVPRRAGGLTFGRQSATLALTREGSAAGDGPGPREVRVRAV